jgi:hypothetical protein
LEHSRERKSTREAQNHASAGPPPSLVFSAPDSTLRTGRQDELSIVYVRLQEALADAQDRGAQQLKIDRAFVEAIYKVLDGQKGELEDLRSKLDGVKVNAIYLK